ncbi:MAG: proteasome assembly chaperone family protein [Candidatus Thermoplasmatota archaeon]|nr:proteasome assembly chaperone family protein [Candidatus Thermoplasmatota archaeon]MBU1941676.1 proteasome assembly chaperone family protein [Candidatus Thermoplasmatota archaeon]
MDVVTINFIDEKPKLNNPIFIEGLPGIGNVGKLAVEHLIEVTKAKKFAELYSKDFPPQVFINPDGTVKLVNNEFYYRKATNKNQPDLILLTGDYQGLSSQGQYELVQSILNVVIELGVKRMYTLGGYGLGHDIKEPKVLFATTHKNLVKPMKEYGAIFRKNEPGGGIIGASGLLLGLGKLQGLEGVCFMGETPGYLVDPNSAKAVLKILMKITKIKVDLSRLEDKAKEIEYIAQQLSEMEGMGKERGDEIQYIG